MRQLIVHLLHEIGFRNIIPCEDGAEALKIIESTTTGIDVIVCDLEMPIIGGIEFIQMLRNNKNNLHAQTPIIVVTGHSEQGNIRQAVALGIHAFLVKPLSRKALEERVHHALTHGPIDPAVFAKKNRHTPPVKIIEG